MSITDFINIMKAIEESLLNYLISQNDDESAYSKLIKIIGQNKILEDKNKLKPFLYLLVSISKHHHRTKEFYNKIEKTILYLITIIKQTFSEEEIFDIFKSSKILTLILINQKAITINSEIVKIFYKDKFYAAKYPQYFYPEIKSFLSEYSIERIMEDHKDEIEDENFEEKRKNGENHYKICKLIREDKLDEFIEFVNQSNYLLNSQVNTSIFETNPLLYPYKNATLIDYAVFYGSIQITKYLLLNNIELNSKSWIYAVHSDNAEMIYLLEENEIKPNSYLESYKESIKCHNSNISAYIQSNYITEKDLFFDEEEEGVSKYNTSNITNIALKNYNFNYIIESDILLYPSYYSRFLLDYDYVIIICILLKTLRDDIDINYAPIFFNCFFHEV